MKADKRPAIDGLIADPPPDLRLFLFYGADESGARAAAAKLAKRLVEDDDNMARIAVTAADLKAAPSRLADEGAAISMFGGRKVVWVEPIAGQGAMQVIPAAETALAADTIENPAILIAGDLKPTHALVKLVGGADTGAALRFYTPSAKEAAVMVAELCKVRGLEPTRSVLARLGETAQASVAVAEQEIEKYALYLGAEPGGLTPLEDDTLDTLGAAFAEAAFSDLVNAVLGGAPDRAVREQARLTAEGKAPVAQVRALLRRIHQLIVYGATKPAGLPPATFVNNMGRRVFWKDKDALTLQLTLWPIADAERALARMIALESYLKSSGKVDDALLASEAFLALARRASVRARRSLR
jgi:DNA polymerase-3 subunit delta